MTRHLRIVLAALAVALVLIIYSLWPQDNCRLNNPRFAHEATLLPDGRVLVTGGTTLVERNPNPAFRHLQFLRRVPFLASWIPETVRGFEEPQHSEILDLRTRHWHLCAPIGENEGGVSLVLDNGRVFRQLADNLTSEESNLKATIFDPISGKWESAVDFSKLGEFQHGTLLSDDKFQLVADPLWVDPKTGRFNVIDLHLDNNDRFYGWGVQLDGQTALFGGFSPGDVCKIYTFLDGQMTDTGTMLVPQYQSRATVLKNGQVLVSGGANGKRIESECELFNPKAETWAMTSAMNAARWGQTATILLDGRVLVTGGLRSEYEVCDTCEIYDPASGRWTTTGSMHQPRVGHSATLLPSGQVLVVGGTDRIIMGPPDMFRIVAASALDSCELYDPATGTWTLL